MKKYIPYLVTSALSAVIALLFVGYVQKPEKIIINGSPSGNIAKNVEDHVLFDKGLSIATPPTDFVEAAKIGRSSAVYIKAVKGEGGISSLAFGSGSGIVISADGYIATNEHVIRDASTVEVTLDDNREYKAKIIGSDTQTDLALLKIEVSNMVPATFGDSDSLQVGEWVMAVGNPFRLQSTVTAGIVSAKARNINILKGKSGIESFIQTDAAVNPGNSGGALINTRGEVVGINSAIMAEGGSYEGYSFAIPSNLAQKVIYDLKSYGAVQRGWLGITIKNIDQSTATNLGLKKVRGIYVVQVNKDEAANLAGIQSGDVITKVNDIELKSTPQFMELVGRYRPGDEIKISYFRDGKFKSTTAKLRNQINSTDFITIRKDGVFRDLGLEVRDLTKEEQYRLKKDGVYVISINKSKVVGKTNMDPGYVITHCNGEEITESSELMTILENNPGKVVLDGFYENYPDQYSYQFYFESDK